MAHILGRAVKARLERVQAAIRRRFFSGPRLQRVTRLAQRAGRLAGRAGRIGLRLFAMAAAAPIWALLERLAPSNKQRKFEQDLIKTLQIAQVAEGDVVFIPTLGDLELSGLIGACGRWRPARALSWRLMFRRNIFEETGAARLRAANRIDVRRLRVLLDLVQRSLQGLDLRIFTDTDPLTAQYSSLGIFKFETAPIPVDERIASIALSERTPGPVRLAYLGDARNEKGYQHLPAALDTIAFDLMTSNKVRLLAQSNFNTKTGDADCVRARLSLSTWPRDQVELVYGPFDSDEYLNLLSDCDALLIPYDQSNYSARSSGVFVEALRAGKPTIVTSGTWMASVLEPYRQEHLRANLPAAPGPRRRFYHAKRAHGDRVVGELIHMPTGASNALICELACAVHPEQFLRLDIRCFDEHGMEMAGNVEFIGLIAPRLMSVSLLPRGVRSVSVSSSVPGAVSTIVPEEVSLTLWRAPERFPVSYGGVFTAPNPLALGEAMRNLEANFQAYAAHARRLAAEIGVQHSPSRLLDLMVAAPRAPADRSAEPGPAAPNAPIPIDQARRARLKAQIAAKEAQA